eukprot:711134-Pyramimonas_sp.AAC.1
MHRPLAGLGFGPVRRLCIRERRTLCRPVHRLYTGLPQTPHRLCIGLSQACAQPVHRPAIGLCVGRALVCRRVFECTRALGSDGVETCAHHVHRPMYCLSIGLRQGYAQPIERPIIGLSIALLRACAPRPSLAYT